MKKYQCDKCLEIVNPEKIVALDICELDDQGIMASYIIYSEICVKCLNEIYLSLKNKKVDVDDKLGKKYLKAK